MLADHPPLLVLTITTLVAGVGAILPFSPAEPLLVGIAAVTKPWLLVPMIAFATVSSMVAKTLVYEGSGKVERALSPRKRALLERMRSRLAGRRGLQIATVFLSATCGLPPFYLVTLVCGALRLPIADYLLAGTTGRAVRFSAIMMLPQLFATA
ncbi:MAG: hypothetical protein WD825_01910 [Gemmatimonadaceae bacterium]